MSSWYDKCMPKIKDVQLHISKDADKLREVNGIKGIYVWGSYANNLDHPNFRLRDIDILVKTEFNSGDLLAIENDIVKNSHSDDYLEDQGYDPSAIKFSQKFLDFSKQNIDYWAISCDRKLLHWGAIPINKIDSKDVNQEAEKYAVDFTGITRKKINSASETNRKNWYNSYCYYVKKYFDGMPTGWYQTEDVKIKEILAKAIKL